MEQMDRDEVPRPKVNIFPIISVCIGAFALCFQIFVLYPWHLQLSSEFASLQESCIKEKIT